MCIRTHKKTAPEKTPVDRGCYRRHFKLHAHKHQQNTGSDTPLSTKSRNRSLCGVTALETIRFPGERDLSRGGHVSLTNDRVGVTWSNIPALIGCFTPTRDPDCVLRAPSSTLIQSIADWWWWVWACVTSETEIKREREKPSLIWYLFIEYFIYIFSYLYILVYGLYIWRLRLFHIMHKKIYTYIALCVPLCTLSRSGEYIILPLIGNEGELLVSCVWYIIWCRLT